MIASQTRPAAYSGSSQGSAIQSAPLLRSTVGLKATEIWRSVPFSMLDSVITQGLLGSRTTSSA